MKIATHNGWYHADDVLAVSVLKTLYPKAEIVRTRDPEVIASCNIVVDVGCEYNNAKKRFDHHQVNPPLRNEERGEKYSAFGLIWKHYGRNYIRHFYPGAPSKKIDFIWYKLNNGFVREIDLNDTGDLPVSSAHIASLINAQNEITSFEDMLPIVTLLIRGAMRKFADRFDARILVEKAYEEAEDKRIIVLNKNIPWKSVVPDGVLFAVIYDDITDDWKVGTTSTKEDPMKPNRPLKLEWWGLRDEELSEVSGIKDCVFVHNTGFIGGNKTFEGALAMVHKSLED